MSDVMIPPAQADALPVVESPAVDPAVATPPVVASDIPAPPEAAQKTEGEAEPQRDPKTGRFAARTQAFQSQISTLRAEKGSLDREVNALKREKEKLEKERASLQPVDPNDFAAQDTARLNKTLLDRDLKAVDARLENATQRDADVRIATFNAKIDAARERIPDIDQVLATLAPLPFSAVMAEVIAESDKAPELAVWFSRNPADAYRIAKLPPHKQSAEVVRIEARVSAPQPKRISTAPAPLQTASGGTSVSAPDPTKMGMADYIKWRQTNAG
jgi:prefoldin subunit 5